MKRPSVTVRPARLCSPGETIVEFLFPDGSGGLLSFRDTNVGPTIDVYHTDPTVRVFVPERNRTP
jgi:hypothetical protein